MQIMQTDRSQAGRYTAAYVRFCLAHYRCDLRAPDRPRFPGACMGVRFEDAPGRRGRRAHGGFEAATAVAADIARALRALASDRLLAAGAAAIIWRGPGAVDADGRPRRWPGPGQTVPWAVIARRFRLARRPLIAAASDAVEWMARWLNGERMITPPRSQAAIAQEQRGVTVLLRVEASWHASVWALTLPEMPTRVELRGSPLRGPMRPLPVRLWFSDGSETTAEAHCQLDEGFWTTKRQPDAPLRATIIAPSRPARP